jgi:hypothetical protein
MISSPTYNADVYGYLAARSLLVYAAFLRVVTGLLTGHNTL